MIDRAKFVEALQCGNAGCQCHKNGSSQYSLHCPAHNDEHPSLSVTFTDDGKVLYKDHAGCDQKSVTDALRAKGLIGSDGARHDKSNTPASGLTLQQYADAKGIPIEFLKRLGLSDCRHRGAPAVRMPYPNEAGEFVTERYRVALTGEHRFEWKSGARAILYGLAVLAEIRRKGWVILVEGESDCHTLWFYKLPALGIPGKSTFRPEWAELLEGVAVYLWQEPDAQDLTRKVGASIPGLRVIVAPEGIKDPSAAHIQGLDVPAWLESLKAQSVAFADIQQAETGKIIAELEAKAASVLAYPDPLQLVEAEIKRQGYGGDLTPAKIVYLVMTARVCEMRPGAMPPHALVLGPASAGKSYVILVVRRLLPPEALHVIDAGSPRALIYDQADLRHRVVVFGEADSIPAGEDNPAASAIRNLLADGVLRYSIVERDEETGAYATREIVKDGPSVLITTATRRLGEQLMTRLFTLEIGDEPEHVRAALMKQASIEREGVKEPDPALIAFQGLLQARAPWRVSIPFSEVVAELIGESITAPRVLRDFARLLALIRAVAILRHRHRETDSQGRIIATVEDYATVRELVSQVYADSVSDTTKRARETVEAVRRMIAANPNAKITVTGIASELGIGKMAASRRAKEAVRAGGLVNSETRRGHPANFALGEVLPEAPGLPTVAAIKERNRLNWLSQQERWLERNPQHPDFALRQQTYAEYLNKHQRIMANRQAQGVAA